MSPATYSNSEDRLPASPPERRDASRTSDAVDASASDEALMLAAKLGNADAFTLLAGRYASRVLAFCLQATRERASAEEIAQETWLGLWRARTSYTQTTTFAAWLFTAARNRCKNRRRAGIRALLGRGRSANDDVDVEALEGSSRTALDDLVLDERRRELSRKVHQLSDTLREALILRVVDELSYADIAAVIGVPEATARSRVRLAVERLRELIQQDPR